MKAVKITFVVLSAALLAIGIGTTASAFHSGGVAECGGCHSMHAPKAGGSFLLVGGDQSSTCLSCHEHAGDTGPSSYHVTTATADLPAGTAPKQRTPGGDFGWLKKSYTFSERHHDHARTARRTATTSSRRTTATSPTRPTRRLPAARSRPTSSRAHSCHDPHGQYPDDWQSGTIAKTGAPIIGSGSYNDSDPSPTASRAVGVYRLLARRRLHQGPRDVQRRSRGKGPVHLQPDRGDEPGPRRLRRRDGERPRDLGRTGAAPATRTMHSTGNYVHPVDQSLGSTIAAIYRLVREVRRPDRKRGHLLHLARPVHREHGRLQRRWPDRAPTTTPPPPGGARHHATR